MLRLARLVVLLWSCCAGTAWARGYTCGTLVVNVECSGSDLAKSKKAIGSIAECIAFCEGVKAPSASSTGCCYLKGGEKCTLRDGTPKSAGAGGRFSASCTAAEATAAPTDADTAVPSSVSPTPEPTAPTAAPTAEPTAVSTVEPTVPTARPTGVPTVTTAGPTAGPPAAPPTAVDGVGNIKTGGDDAQIEHEKGSWWSTIWALVAGFVGVLILGVLVWLYLCGGDGGGRCFCIHWRPRRHHAPLNKQEGRRSEGGDTPEPTNNSLELSERPVSVQSAYEPDVELKEQLAAI